MLLDYWRKIYARFLKLRGTSKELALGFALGLFIGFTPTMGIQMALGVFFASLFKWSKITAAIGVQITNPITAPFLYTFTYYIGAKIMGLDKLPEPGWRTVPGLPDPHNPGGPGNFHRHDPGRGPDRPACSRNRILGCLPHHGPVPGKAEIWYSIGNEENPATDKKAAQG